ncbi:MAG TPA: ABC transporter substrate-binding protein [Fibrobacteraceae bacterium]|nr:ABC transporter substrate-binding protein [Fibrobacteraceae bacterium]
MQFDYFRIMLDMFLERRPGKADQIVLIVLLWALSVLAAVPESVVLQLNGPHSFRYAGFYMAETKGFYAQEDLNVRILPLPSRTTPADAIIFGRADYGVEGADLLLDWSEGKPIISLAAIYQKSSTILVVPSDVTIPEQLQGKAVFWNRTHALEMQVMFLNAGVSLDSIHLQQTNDEYQSFRLGRLDAFAADQGIAPERLLRDHMDFNVILPGRYGVDFYGDCLITSRRELEQNPRRAKAFLRATLKGWTYAMEHLDESISLVKREFQQEADSEQIAFEAQSWKDLFQATRVIPGEQNLALWQQNADMLFRLGLLHERLRVRDNIYSLQRIEQEEKTVSLHTVTVVAVIALVAVFALFGLVSFFWWKMRLRNRELHHGEARLQLALRATSDAAWEWPELSGPLWIAPLGYTMFEIDPNGFLPTWDNLLAHFHPEDRPELIRQLDEVRMAGEGAIAMDFRVHTSHGERWLRVRGLVSDDERKRMTGLFQNIHELKCAELALREREGQFRQYFELGLVGMASVERDGRFRQVNRVFCELLDTVEEILLQKNWKDVTHPDDWSLEEDLMASVMRRERQGYTIDKRLCSLSGKNVYVLAAVRAVFDSTGCVAHWVMLIQDITQRRQGEQEKERILHQLSLKNRTLEGLLHSISHDFRHPLVNMIWHCQDLAQSQRRLLSLPLPGLKEEARQLLHQEMPNSLEEIHQGAQTMDRMLTGILSLSRLGKQIPEPAPVEMRCVVQALLEEMQILIQNSQAVIECGELPSCLGNEAMLYQIWKNLLLNALQYREITRSLQIRIEGKVVRDWVVYSIEDNGMGIPSRNLSDIFMPFFRLSAKENEITGEGLGLTIVTRILESLRGHIKVESELGKGSRFCVYLPKGSG